jgi:hypothetical protein
MPVTLESRVRQMQVFNLPHHVYCEESCSCSESTVTLIAENPRTGERAIRQVTRTTPDSLTLLAGERRAGLPTALLKVPEVKAAIARGRIRIVEQSQDKTARSAPTGKSSQSAHGPAQKDKEK